MAVREETISEAVAKKRAKEIVGQLNEFDVSSSDVSSLLKLAEEIKEKITESDNVIGRYKLLTLTELIICLISMIGLSLLLLDLSLLLLLFNSSATLRLNTMDISVALILLIIALLLAITQHTSKMNRVVIKQRLDKIALSEVLQLLREVESNTAIQENWSVLKRAEFRIRLSRFDMREEKSFPFNLFS